MRFAFSSLRVLTAAFFLLSIGINAAALAGGHQSAAPAKAAPADIVDTAVATGSFTTLVAAVQAADLVDALKGEGPLTVFAPNDAAFKLLWPGTLENLLKPENKANLTALLLHHVVAGKIMSSDLSGSTTVETLNGDNITVIANKEGVTVQQSNVVAADIVASNGVIHVIDQVMLPQPK